MQGSDRQAGRKEHREVYEQLHVSECVGEDALHSKTRHAASHPCTWQLAFYHMKTERLLQIDHHPKRELHTQPTNSMQFAHQPDEMLLKTPSGIALGVARHRHDANVSFECFRGLSIFVREFCACLRGLVSVWVCRKPTQPAFRAPAEQKVGS